MQISTGMAKYCHVDIYKQLFKEIMNLSRYNTADYAVKWDMQYAFILPIKLDNAYA